jgi:hypothetical protein
VRRVVPRATILETHCKGFEGFGIANFRASVLRGGALTITDAERVRGHPLENAGKAWFPDMPSRRQAGRRMASCTDAKKQAGIYPARLIEFDVA